MANISSGSIKRYIERLEKAGLSTHSMIISEGENIVFEHYWAPFSADFLHRQYSVSKSIVAIAVGFAVQEGLFSLDDRISELFPEYASGNYTRQTVRDMLMMSTEKVDQNWFKTKTQDRLKTYFANTRAETKGHGDLFDYDSSGAFVLGALVEKMSGCELAQYLHEKLFDRIGVSKEAYFLKCPGGHAWGDSGFMCTARDLLKIARFVMKKGEGLLSEEYLTDATSALIFNNDLGINDYDTHGYGYLIWRSYENSFAFLGMGCQIVLCLPDRNICLIVNSDNQGIPGATKLIIDGFFDMLHKDSGDITDITEFCKTLKLAVSIGEKDSPISSCICGKEYVFGENPMGLKCLKVVFKGNGGTLVYKNDRGEKKLPFGLCENVFGKFPEEGYSDLVGGENAEGNYYNCAASAGWVEQHKLFIKVQITDKYFGRLNIILSFKDDRCSVRMVRTAEGFLGDYSGFAEGKCQ